MNDQLFHTSHWTDRRITFQPGCNDVECAIPKVKVSLFKYWHSQSFGFLVDTCCHFPSGFSVVTEIVRIFIPKNSIFRTLSYFREAGEQPMFFKRILLKPWFHRYFYNGYLADIWQADIDTLRKHQHNIGIFVYSTHNLDMLVCSCLMHGEGGACAVASRLVVVNSQTAILRDPSCSILPKSDDKLYLFDCSNDSHRIRKQSPVAFLLNWKKPKKPQCHG